MKAIEYPIKHYYQPTNDSCGYTALAILLSHYKREIKPEQLLQAVPEAKPEGEDAYGSITPQLATWCLNHGFDVQLTTFDFLILDLEWAKLNNTKEIIERLEAVKDVRNVPSLGKSWSKVYIEEYINYLETGGKLTIKSHVATELLYEMLKNSPVYANVSATPLYNHGRMKYLGVREEVPDDISGHVGTHSVIVYGNNDAGDFLLADPWYGLTVVGCEALMCSITAAEIECDAMCFQLAVKT